MAAIGTSASLQSASRAEPAEIGFQALTTQEFTEIILAELSNQDPLEPNDTQALLEQLSAIQTIESNTRLTDSLDALVARDEFATAATLIGRDVSGLDEAGLNAEGRVRSVSQTTDGVVVTLENGTRMPFGDVAEIIAPQDDAVGGDPGSDDGSTDDETDTGGGGS